MSDSSKSRSHSSYVESEEFKPKESKSDSDESFTSYSDEFLELNPSLNLHPCLSSTGKNPDVSGDNKKIAASKNLTWGTIDGFDPSEVCSDISVWERWLVLKLKVEKEQAQEKKELEKLAKIEKEKQLKLERERKLLAQKRHQEWLEEKMLKMKIQQAREKRQEKIKKEIENEKQVELKVKSEINFKKWLKDHEELDRERKQKESEKKEKELQEKEEKRKKAEETYQQWLRDNKDRFSTLRKKEPPTPSYVNPNPWIGPDHDEARRRPGFRQSRPQSNRENRAPLVRSQSCTIKRCSTPKPRSRGLETHTPLRMGKPVSPRPTSSPSLMRVHTPLRFSGYRSKSGSCPQKRADHSAASQSISRSRTEAPRPLCGMQNLTRSRPRSYNR